MSQVNAERGNEFFTTVENTVVNGSSIENALAPGKRVINVLEGTANPTLAATNYPVQDADNVTLQLPAGSVILSVVVTGGLTAGAASATIFGGSATDGGLVSFPYGVVDINASSLVSGFSLTLVGAGPTNDTDRFVSVSTGAAAPTGGPVSVRIAYYVA